MSPTFKSVTRGSVAARRTTTEERLKWHPATTPAIQRCAISNPDAAKQHRCSTEHALYAPAVASEAFGSTMSDAVAKGEAALAAAMKKLKVGHIERAAHPVRRWSHGAMWSTPHRRMHMHR